MTWKKLISFPNQKVIGKEYDITYWKVENNKVWHQWKKLMKADIESFEIYEGTSFIGRDKDFIYHGWTKLSKIDRASFERVSSSYWKDKNCVYAEYETSLKPLKGLDAASFKYLENGFAYDNTFAYYYGYPIKSCQHPTTLRVIKEDHFFAIDKEQVYYERAVLKNADLETWRLLPYAFSRDDKRIYFTARKLPRVDVETWEHIHRTYSKDKNRVYCMEQVVENASPDEWDKEKVLQLYIDERKKYE